MQYQFNPFEISICGYSGLGKTTLICKLLQSLSKKYRVGYIKHDAHRFEMDKKGKDTYQASQNGASGVGIYSSEEGIMAFLGKMTLLCIPIIVSFLLKHISPFCGAYIIGLNILMKTKELI